MWEGVVFREMVNRSRDLVKNQCDSDLWERDLLDLCLEIEQGHLATPQPKFYPKKFRRFRALGGQVCRQRDLVIRACREVDQSLFPDEMGAVDDEEWLNPPKGPMILSLEELIQITADKRVPPRLADRRIQVLGRRLPKFVPPQRKDSSEVVGEHKIIKSVLHKIREVESMRLWLV
jgi:hypothetical protein